MIPLLPWDKVSEDIEYIEGLIKNKFPGNKKWISLIKKYIQIKIG